MSTNQRALIFCSFLPLVFQDGEASNITPLLISVMSAFSSPSKCTIKSFYGTLSLPQNIWSSAISEPLWMYLLSLLLPSAAMSTRLWVFLCKWGNLLHLILLLLLSCFIFTFKLSCWSLNISFWHYHLCHQLNLAPQNPKINIIWCHGLDPTSS